MNVSVKEMNGKIVFLQSPGRLQPQLWDHVAQLAGMPRSLVRRQKKC